MKRIRSAAVVFALSATTWAAPPDGVAAAFHDFEALNAALAVPHDCECQAYQAQEDVARYTDGPLARALDRALDAICAHADGETLDALVKVALTTAEASADTFTEPLMHAYACQPALVEQRVTAAAPEARAMLLDLLHVGVENAGLSQPADDALRARLHVLGTAVDRLRLQSRLCRYRPGVAKDRPRAGPPLRHLQGSGHDLWAPPRPHHLPRPHQTSESDTFRNATPAARKCASKGLPDLVTS